MNGNKDLTNSQKDDILFSIQIDLSVKEGFVVEAFEGRHEPTISDILLALQVAKDSIMNQYYQNMEALTSFSDVELQGGVESIVKKAEGDEV